MGRRHFVLVHGSQHGAWCWYKTKHLLESAGHRVTAVDLTSAGISTVSADDVKSFDHYSQPLYDLFESLAESEKVILVGHSMGGLSVARATERYPSKIHVAVYLGAIMLCSDQPYSEIHTEVFGQFLKFTSFNFAKGAATYPTSWWVVEEAVKDTYFGSCSPKDVQLARSLLRPSPCYSDDATTFTTKGYHSVPRVYIRTSLDTLLLPKFQDLFISRNRPKEVRTIETGHAAFLSAPKDLHEHLVQIAGTYAS
ncbi:hypothetical protein M758_3G111000 [Ceratodon purpureus]|uniref:AB hydrolase-1 domain-containing protein n=1 Tax=Ceratodon purpureus TaxID=3225 RepID=A0A8T0IKL9_CERPU|nr:hypothetical protein KC19_3G109200 [Ceratodon purpureus]KAG0622608.1 hypothetical protein M758_3G111000 [Ceratodon purpureus]